MNTRILVPRFSPALALTAALLAEQVMNAQSPGQSEPIPLEQLGAVAGNQYEGDGMRVVATPEGARLRCVFQKLKGEVTREGLWLISTVAGAQAERFRVMAVEVGRDQLGVPTARLARRGEVSVDGQTVRLVRPGLTEEYGVSVDGVRQDFVIPERPTGEGALRVELAVTGAQVEPLVNAARLVLAGSGRRIAYSRLQVRDATGKELSARMAVQKPSAFSLQPSAFNLAVVVEDAAAAYPVRIDPTFSDENWVGMNSAVIGADDTVRAAVVDGSGHLYLGGDFTVVGDAVANHVAKWDGSSWSALGMGVNDSVYALAVSGSDLYVGGYFTTAGGNSANRVAKWDGSSWSGLGEGMNGYGVYALAVSGSDLYAGGQFTTAGGSTANRVAKWNGSSWSPLVTGVNDSVRALGVSGSDLYVGGNFTTAGGSAANRIAKWDGNSWSALGSGVEGTVTALAVSGSDVYAGGSFTNAGNIAARSIAKWNGSSWSALGSGMGPAISGYYPSVHALAVSGSDLYVGGHFTTAGGATVNHIAKWDGSNWSPLGSGMNSHLSGINGSVSALAVSGGNLYVGGSFTTAGGKVSAFVAQAHLPSAGGRFGDVTYSPASGFQFLFQDATPGEPYRIQRATSIPSGPWTDFTNVTYTGPTTISDPSPGVGTNRFYRAVSP